jgi:hypothetical protein
MLASWAASSRLRKFEHIAAANGMSGAEIAGRKCWLIMEFVDVRVPVAVNLDRSLQPG